MYKSCTSWKMPWSEGLLKLLKTFPSPMLPAAYGEAWSTFTNRFDNTRKIIGTLLNGFFGLAKIKCDSEIRSVLDSFNRIIRGLKIAIILLPEIIVTLVSRTFSRTKKGSLDLWNWMEKESDQFRRFVGRMSLISRQVSRRRMLAAILLMK